MGAETHLSVRAAISGYLAAIQTALAPRSLTGVRAVLTELERRFPEGELSLFDSPQGTALVKDVLDARWGHLEPDTYRKSLSVLRTFFEWYRDEGHIARNPAREVNHPAVRRKPRETITRSDTERLFAANPWPREQVPLQLLVTVGLSKSSLRHVRFSDLDHATKTVRYERRGEVHTKPIPDDGFWETVATLQQQRHAQPDEYVLPAERSRRDSKYADHLEDMERDGFLDHGRSYLWQADEGTWMRATLLPHEPRGDHGAHLWWYRCLRRAGLVAAGDTSGLKMQSARYTFGRRRFTEIGILSELEHELGGLDRSGSVSDVYKNQDADSLDTAIRRALLRLPVSGREPASLAIGLDSSSPPRGWWKEPMREFVKYVDDERDLIELSRVSVEMLRKEEKASDQLHDAAETLTRAVSAAELVTRAHEESQNDHPLLHGHSVVAIWSALEAMVSDVLDAWLLWWPPARARAISKATSIPNDLPPAEWVDAVRDALNRGYRRHNEKTKSKRRLDYYEWLLRAVGLPDDEEPHDPLLSSNLFEMQQVRNAFAHKRGRADRIVLENCPQLPFELDQQIRIDRHAWADLLETTVLYADSISRRIRRELGLSERLHSIPAPEIRYPRA